MNKRAIGILLIVIGIVDVLVTHTIIREVLGIDFAQISDFIIVQYLPYILSGIFVMFGLRMVFQGAEDEYAQPTRNPKPMQQRAAAKQSVPKPKSNADAIALISKHLKEQGVRPPQGTATQEPLFPAPEKMKGSLEGLTPEQQQYVKGFSVAALVNPFIWAVMNGQGAFAAFLFVPVFNFFIWLALAFKGRHIAWASKNWDYEQFQARQRAALIIGVMLTASFWLLIALAEPKGY